MPYLNAQSVESTQVRSMTNTSVIPQYNPKGHSFSGWLGGKSQLARTIVDLMPAHKAYVEVSGDTESQPQAIGGGTYAKSMPNCVAFGCEFKDEDNAIHGNNENIKIDSLLKSTEIFAKAIYDLIKE